MQTHWTCPNGISHSTAVLEERSRHRTGSGVIRYLDCSCGHVVIDLIRWDSISTSIAARVGVAAPRRAASIPAA